MIAKIKKFVSDGKVQIRHHARIQMRARRIRIDDAIEVMLNGEIIEEYTDDIPFPSYLICGKYNRSIHVVCALSEDDVIIITAYEPDPDKWIDFKFRKKSK